MDTSGAAIEVSPCGTHHVQRSRPLYERRFINVLKFHPPGLAPALDEEGAFHIRTDGTPTYGQKYKRTFGFYENRASVEDEEGCFHIFPDGSPVYSEKYAWCGNFQEGFCPVRTFAGAYHHITLQGDPLYPERYTYVGDFKEGSAVVCDKNGQHSHIDRNGTLIHNTWFHGLDVFHKGFARAKDVHGWFHITPQGKPAYTQRYACLEPFYNGVAHAQDLEGRLVLIAENGQEIKELVSKPLHTHPDAIEQLSCDMVGFWKTWALYAAIDLKVLDVLPSTAKEVSTQLSIPLDHVARLFRALWELDIIFPREGSWYLAPKGACLAPSSTSFMAAASFMWSQVNDCWKDLGSLLRQPSIESFPSFKEAEEDPFILQEYQRALAGYAHKDCLQVSELPCWQNHKILLGFGRSSLYLVPELLETYPHLQATLLGPDKTLKSTIHHHLFQKRLFKKEWSLGSPFFLQADAILFPKFLHYFSNNHVQDLLTQARLALLEGGTIYILEMLLQEGSPEGGLFDLNMMCESGGKVRSLENWQTLFSQTGLSLRTHQKLSPFLSLLEVSVTP